MGEYQKAYICPYKDGRPELQNKFYVPFNPAELTIEEGIGISSDDDNTTGQEIENLLAGSKVGWQQALIDSLKRKRTSRIVLSTTLFFNTLTNLSQESYEDVRTSISRLYCYTNKNIESSGVAKQIYFFWGSIAVAGMLTRMSVHYTMFAPDGKPVRAKVDISIEGDYVGEQTSKEGEGDSTGTARTQTDINTMLGEDPSTWKSRCSSTGNPRTQEG